METTCFLHFSGHRSLQCRVVESLRYGKLHMGGAMTIRVSKPSPTIGREKTTVARGDVLEVDLEPTQGGEMAKTRPCVVVSNNRANQSSPLIIVAAITSQEPKKPYPFLVKIPSSANMPKPSWINTAHIRTIARSRLTGRYFTSLDRETMRKVDAALKKQLGIP